MLLSLPAYLSQPVKILLTLQGQVSPLLDTFLNPQSQVMPPSLCPQPLLASPHTASSQAAVLWCYLLQVCSRH